MTTFQDLVRANNQELERVLRQGKAPERADLNGWEYRGYNTLKVTRLIAAQKFVKGFYQDGNQSAGYNLPVEAPWAGPNAPWVPKRGGLRKQRYGFYDVLDVRPGRYGDYSNSLLLHYGTGRNPIWDPTALLRDFLVQVNPGDSTLLLGKAYGDAIGRGRIFLSFFVLERLRRAPR